MDTEGIRVASTEATERSDLVGLSSNSAPAGMGINCRKKS